MTTSAGGSRGRKGSATTTECTTHGRAADRRAALDALIQRIFATDNTAGFIEREAILREIAPQAVTRPPDARCAFVLAELLARVSTPIAAEDVLLGRVVEGPLPGGMTPGIPGVAATGHVALDWAALLAHGLRGSARMARRSADRLGTPDARAFAVHATACAEAVAGFARRYAAAARAAAAADPPRRPHLLRAAAALEQAPAGPATDFFTALQAIWLVHLVASCYLGARDFAFGRLDQLLAPFYDRDLEAGRLTAEEAVELLAHFCIKANEISGTATWNYHTKPIPCHATKQYLMLGGVTPDGADATHAVTYHLLEALQAVDLPQPVFNIRLHPGTPPGLLAAASETATRAHVQIHFVNDALVMPALEAAGVAPADARDYAMVGYCRACIPGRMDWGAGDYFLSMPQWLLAALDGGRDPLGGTVTPGVPPPEQLASLDDVLDAFCVVVRDRIAAIAQRQTAWLHPAEPDPALHFESLLLADCAARGQDYARGGVRYRPQCYCFGGMATVVNSLAALEQLVFTERRGALTDYLAIVRNGFSGHEALLQEVRTRLPKFGNDDPAVDALATRVGDLVLDVLAEQALPPEAIPLAGFYSLDTHLSLGIALPGTPDGRLQGEPLSENQSPVQGTDLHGLTALLRSVAHHPFARTMQGALNVRVAGAVTPEQYAAIVQGYFDLGGLMLGVMMMDQETLRAAQADPARFRSLCVRIYGFSEYFAALSADLQQEIIGRTIFTV